MELIYHDTRDIFSATQLSLGMMIISKRERMETAIINASPNKCLSSGALNQTWVM